MAANAAQLRMAKRQKDAVKQKRQGWDSGNDAMGHGNDPDAQPWWNIFLGCCAGGRDDGLIDSVNIKEAPKEAPNKEIVDEGKVDTSKKSEVAEEENSKKTEVTEEENSKKDEEEVTEKKDDEEVTEKKDDE